MTNLEKLRELLAHHPAILAELNMMEVFHDVALEEYDGASLDGSELVDIIDWGESPQGGEYWYDLWYEGFPVIPDGCWQDVFGVVHDNETK